VVELRDAVYECDEVLVADEEYEPRCCTGLKSRSRPFPELQSCISPTQTVGGRRDDTL
jgi:NAD-dependent DNA ligase